MMAIKIIIKTINTLIVLAAVVLAIAFVGVRLFGVKLYAVLSGSMEPDYPTGAIIYVVEKDVTELKERDVITFRISGSTIATHRIIEVLEDEEHPGKFLYRTKGDANEHEDGGFVSSDDVIGTPVLTIPKAGYFISYIQNPPGRNYAIAVGAALILFVFVTDSFTNDKKKTPAEKTDGDADGK